MTSDPVCPTTPSMSRGPIPASASAPMPAANVMLRESWPSSTRACSVLNTPTMATSWNGCTRPRPLRVEDQVSHELQLFDVAPAHQQGRDRAVAPCFEPFLDARRRPHERDLVGEVVG